MSDHDANKDHGSDQGARSMLVVLILASLVIGALWGLKLYGSLEDVRTWNATGLVLITLVFVYGLIAGAKAWLSGRTE
ncbi:MAG: hypothetical protein R3F05_08665 [Planctomycetota bacterium]